MTQGQTKIIACRTLIEEMQELLAPGMEALTLESGLHLHPEKLQGTLQAVVDDITADTQTTVLEYGLCSMGVIGLKAGGSTLVIPRQEDCISIFLGSRTYKRALDQEPYRQFSWRAARELNLTYEEMKGTTELPEKICHGPWGGEFVVAPPGHRVGLEDFGMVPASDEPQSQSQ